LRRRCLGAQAEAACRVGVASRTRWRWLGHDGVLREVSQVPCHWHKRWLECCEQEQDNHVRIVVQGTTCRVARAPPRY